jgi:hypothetical protein
MGTCFSNMHNNNPQRYPNPLDQRGVFIYNLAGQDVRLSDNRLSIVRQLYILPKYTNNKKPGC